MKTIYKKLSLLLLISSCMMGSLFAQQVNTVYFMKNIAERNQYNPAFQPIQNVYWDLPITPGIKFEIGNNSVDFNDIIFSQKINGIDSTITFLHPMANKADFLDALKETTRFNTDFSLNLIGFGFRVKKNYFTFNIAQKVNTNLYLPKDLFKLAIYGTDTLKNSSFDLSRLGVNSSSYTEFALGYSRKINDKLTLGANFKYLMGQANISTNTNSLNLDAGIDSWNLNGETTINASIPGYYIPFTSEGIVDFNNATNSISDMQAFDIVATSNWGLGIDLGATYNILPNLELSSSITDIGFIKWRDNVVNSKFEGTYEFSGVNMDVNDNIEDRLDTILQNFEDAFSSTGSRDAYTTYLSSRLNLGAEYSVVNDKIGFGLLSSTLFTNKSAYSDLTASTNFRPYDWFSTSFSYSLLDGQYSCIGAGFQLKMLPFNMYIAFDHIPLKFSKNPSIPMELQSFNIQTGLVVTFGNPKKVGDDDKDGVKNRKDKCPNTPYGYLVDKDGCTVDTDKDGVPDNLDKCPDTYLGTAVDSTGCPLDDDKDGVLNIDDKCPNTPIGIQVDSVGCPLDNDKDGVADYLDKCPNTPAGALVDSIGCPFDTDGDGVLDYLDKCPNTPAEAYSTVDASGCPKDTDGDGVADYRDMCPGTPKAAFGKVDLKGCVLDTDSDGVADYIDNCPRIAGTVNNFGCPEIKAAEKKVFEKALKGIQFQSGKAIIKSSSNSILNQIAAILKENPTYLIQINGHTDNVGKPELNQKLSEDRANAVKDYLANKGISLMRMTAEGYGDIMPIGNNTTAAGRAKNRRVEFIVKFEE